MKKQYLLLLILTATFAVFGVLSIVPSEADNLPPLDSSHSGWKGSSSSESAPASDNVSSGYQAQVHQLKAYLAENPEDSTHILRLARLYQDGHQPEEAVTYYERLLKLKPEDRQSWLDITNCYAAAGQWSSAENTAKRMLAYYPDDEQGQYNLGAIYANSGNRDKARAIWKLLVKAHSEEVAEMAQQSLARLDQTVQSSNANQ